MFQMINNNAGWFRDATVRLSTVSLPDGRFETCLFAGKRSDVVARYDSLKEAIAGHRQLAKKYELTNEVF